jgi:DNA-binding MarR family transcriptional regulator
MVALTEKGWAALTTAAPLVFEAEKELLNGYSRAELRSLAKLLAPLLEQANTRPSPGADISS